MIIDRYWIFKDCDGCVLIWRKFPLVLIVGNTDFQVKSVPGSWGLTLKNRDKLVSLKGFTGWRRADFSSGSAYFVSLEWAKIVKRGHHRSSVIVQG